MCLEYFTLLTSFSSYSVTSTFLHLNSTASIFKRILLMKHRSEADGPCGILYGQNFMFLSKINEKEIKILTRSYNKWKMLHSNSWSIDCLAKVLAKYISLARAPVSNIAKSLLDLVKASDWLWATRQNSLWYFRVWTTSLMSMRRFKGRNIVAMH